MVSILVISHGLFAQELCRSVELIVGNISFLSSMSMDMTEGVEKLKKDLFEKITALSKTNNRLLILCDLYFGCPFITAIECAKSILPAQSFKVVTGVNLPMLLELCVANKDHSADLDNLVDIAVQMGKKGIQEFIFNEKKDDCNESL